MAGWASRFAIRRWVSISVLGTVFWAVLGSRQSGADPPVVPDQTEPDPATNSARWHPSLDRNRSVEQRLQAVRRNLQEDRLHEALTLIQGILDSDADVFVAGPEGVPPTGARKAANALLTSLSPTARQLYATLYDGQAARVLADKSVPEELERLEATVRRFFHTPAGGQAALRLAERWTDRGHWARAAGAWERLQADPAHSRLLTPRHRLRGALCLSLSGRPERAEQWVARLGSLSVGRILNPSRPAEDETSSIRDWLKIQAGLARPSRDSLPGPWSNPRTDGATMPLVTRPRWQLPLAGDSMPHVASILSAWESHQLSRAQPIATSNFAIAVGEQIVFRDVEGLRSVDPATQTTRWVYRAESSLLRIAPAAADAKEGSVDPARVSQLWTASPLQGLISTDGRLVFAIDQLEWRWSSGNPTGGAEVDSIAAARQTNTLVALEVSGPSAGVPRWIAGGPAAVAEPSRSLPGCFFCGPPLTHEGRLYVIAERQQELILACLEAGTGRVYWTQCLCVPQVPIAYDSQRYSLAAIPSAADGVIVCPTHCGVLVAVDADSGSLRWACSLDDADQLERLATWPTGTRRRYEHPAFVNGPLISGGRVVSLSPQSDQVRSVDLSTGRTLWTAARDETEASVEHVAAISQGVVLVVGRRRCRGLSWETGAELWTSPLAQAPCGRGVRLGETYAVPLTDGQLVGFQVATGRPVGLVRPNPKLRPGNLLVAGDLVLSVGPTDLAAYPQSGPLLRQLDSAREPVCPVLKAEVQLALGNSTGARTHLREALCGMETSAPQAAELQSLLREMLCSTRLDQPESEELLADLERLSTTPADRSRFLVRRATLRERQGRIDDLLADLGELLDLGLDEPVAVEGDFGCDIAPECWSRGLLSRLGQNPDRAIRQTVSAFVEERLRRTATIADPGRSRRWVRACADFSQSWPVRLKLTSQLTRAGQTHEPEMQLLLCRRSGDLAARAEATRMLAELMTQRGLPHEAARLLSEIKLNFGNVPVDGQTTGTEYVAALPADDPGQVALRRLSPPDWLSGSSPVGQAFQIHIRQEAGLNQQLHGGNYPLQGKIRSTPRNFAYQLFDREKSTGGELVLVDRIHGGMLPAAITVPPRYCYPVSADQSYVGRFFPLGSQGKAHGVSLLDQRMIWSTVPRGLHPINDIVRVGPAGPDYAIFQCWHHLFVLDPADGHVLWHRHDLSGNSGLMSDPYAGVLADETVLAVFDADRSGYTVYNMSSGQELRRGKLEIDLRQTRRVYGRKLFHYTRSEDRRVRVWDVATDTSVWQEPVDDLQDASPQAGFRPGAKLCTFVADSNEIAYVTRAGRIRVVDAPTGEFRLDAAVDHEELPQVGALRVFGDEHRYYVNLQRWPPTSGQNTFLATDTLLPAAHVQGEVSAYDRRTGELVWQRDLGNRTILLLSEYRLPLLVTFCRVRNASQMSLHVEIVSAGTGQALAERPDLVTDQMLLLSYRRDPLQIVLRGAKSAVTVDITAPPAPLRTAAGDGATKQ